MNTEILGILLMFGGALVIGLPLGKYMARVYGGEKTLLDPVMNPVERLLFRFSGINATKEMNWKQHMVAMLIINMVWFLLGMFVLMNQS